MTHDNKNRATFSFQGPIPISPLTSSRFAHPISSSSLSLYSSRPIRVVVNRNVHFRFNTTSASLSSNPQHDSTTTLATKTTSTITTNSSYLTEGIENEDQSQQQEQQVLEHPSLHPLRIISSSAAKSKQESTQYVVRALTPMRRPRDDPSTTFTEEPTMPSQRRSDIMAPKGTGFWFFVPYLAAASVFLAVSFVGRRRLIARQKRLVEEFGQVMALYGNTPESRRDIASEYKRKLGPGILREAMFSSYLHSLVSEKAIVPTTIQDVGFVKRALRLSDDRVVKAINRLGEELKDAPSLLGKVLFLSQRVITQPDKLKKISLVPLFPYSAETVYDLQRNMLERCYKEYVSDEIDASGGEVHEAPMAVAGVLQLDTREAQRLFDSVVLARQRKKEREEEEARLVAEAAEVEQATAFEKEAELDSIARSGEPAKAEVHAYQCTECGYTLFPAAGREFKFYGDDFVCPACGSPKDKFIDINADE